MVIQLKPYMADRVPANVWGFLCRQNARIISDRDRGKPPTERQLHDIAQMIRYCRQAWDANRNTNNNTNTKG